MVKSGKGGKPSGAKTAYVCFLQVCREEHQRKSPGVPIVLKDFSRSCSEKWKALVEKDKRRFQDMAARDKLRYQKEMESYIPPPGEKKKKRKIAKDPNKPKRNLSAFFFFCNEKRPAIQLAHPDWKVGSIAKDLGKMWEQCTERQRYITMAENDKVRYERDIEAYRKGASFAVHNANGNGKANGNGHAIGNGIANGNGFPTNGNVAVVPMMLASHDEEMEDGDEDDDDLLDEDDEDDEDYDEDE